MANWRSAGHAIRRREGAPSSHVGSLSVAGRVNLPTADEALAGMAKVGSPRVPMGNDVIMTVVPSTAITVSGVGQLPTTPRHAAAGDPALVPGLGHRNPIMAERLGSRFAISVRVPSPTLPEAGATQANGRIVPAVGGFNRPFVGGLQD